MTLIYFLLNFAFSYRFSILEGNATIFDENHFLLSKQFSNEILEIKLCHSCSAYISKAETLENHFIVYNNNSEDLYFMYSYKSLDFNIVSVTHAKQKTVEQIRISPNSSFIFHVKYFCKLNNAHEKKWAIIQINFTINNAENQAYYYKQCNHEEKAFHPYFILIFLSTMCILFGSKYGLHSNNIFGEIQQETLGIITIFLLLMLSSILLISFLKFENIGVYFTTIFVMLISFLATETLVLDLLNFHNLPTKFKLISSTIICISLIISYLYWKNWLLNDIQAISILLFSLKNIEVDNLRSGFILLFLSLCYETFWIFISPQIFGFQILQTYGSKLELPIKLLSPSFNKQLDSPIQQCSILGIGDILIMGIVIKYIFKFEESNRSSKIIFACSLIGYTLGLLLYFITGYFYYFTWYPALFCIFPSTFAMITSASLCQKNFSQLWHGDQNNNIIQRIEIDSI